MPKATKRPKEFTDAKHFRCETCDVDKPLTKRHKVSPPKLNTQSRISHVDIKDANNIHYNLLNVVCHGTTFQQASVVRVADAHGVPN